MSHFSDSIVPKKQPFKKYILKKIESGDLE